MAHPTLTHIALHCRDVARSIDFYERYAGLEIVHERGGEGGRVVWLAEPGREKRLVMVLIDGGPGADQAERDYSHLGFAVHEREEVERLAARAEAAGHLAWPVREGAWPVGVYCGLRDPDGRVVEFSFGQPLGPGAPEDDPDAAA